jgi:hypothetical protein
MMLILNEEQNGKELSLLSFDYKNSGEKTFTKLMELKNLGRKKKSKKLMMKSNHH